MLYSICYKVCSVCTAGRSWHIRNIMCYLCVIAYSDLALLLRIHVTLPAVTAPLWNVKMSLSGEITWTGTPFDLSNCFVAISSVWQIHHTDVVAKESSCYSNANHEGSFRKLRTPKSINICLELPNSLMSSLHKSRSESAHSCI